MEPPVLLFPKESKAKLCPTRDRIVRGSDGKSYVLRMRPVAIEDYTYLGVLTQFEYVCTPISALESEELHHEKV